MKFGAREITIVASLGIHGIVAAMALSVAHDKQQRRATTVALAEQKKKDKPEDKKPEPPKPPPPAPKPKPVAPKPVAAPVPVAAPAPEPVASAAASAPMQTDIAMGNDVGMDMGTGARPKDEVKNTTTQQTPGGKPKPAAATVKTPIKVDAPPPKDESGACTEPAGKPEPSVKTDIEYTEEARAAGIEGRLVLKVTVDADGNVTDVKVVNSVDPALDAAAIQTVKTWRFKPAMACGKPVAGGTYTIARRFVLGD